MSRPAPIPLHNPGGRSYVIGLWSRRELCSVFLFVFNFQFSKRLLMRWIVSFDEYLFDFYGRGVWSSVLLKLRVNYMLMQFVLLIYLGKKRKISRVNNFEVTNWRFWRCRVRQAFCCYEIASILALSQTAQTCHTIFSQSCFAWRGKCIRRLLFSNFCCFFSTYVEADKPFWSLVIPQIENHIKSHITFLS